MAIGLSQRTGAVIEPRLSTQWFLRIAPLAEKAIAAVEEGHIRFTPDQYRKSYMEWMHNIHDWCISRQLWWGHRIPAWHCADCQQISVARVAPDACTHCGSTALEQETDVLDTWFSSGLLPFTADLAVFYPTSLLVTGSDILFFWVARMVMFGCWFMGQEQVTDSSSGTTRLRTLAESVPFREVYIHALVRDADRQKMSKTKGNVIDPIGIVKQYGTDAVRFTLASMASPGTDIAFNEQRTEGYRAFANKIWNAARFIFMNVDRAAEAGITVNPITLAQGSASEAFEARWITARLSQTAAAVDAALRAYRFDDAANLIYQFFWGDFCDWYLEIVKLRLQFSSDTTAVADKDKTERALRTLLSTFETSLRLLSPFMPFLTEELWQAVYDEAPPLASVGLAAYPKTVPAGSLYKNISAQMEELQSLIVAIRAIRKELGVEEKASVPVRVRASERLQQTLQETRSIVERLARVSSIELVSGPLAGAGVRSTLTFDVQVVYEKQIDVAAETARLTKELTQYEKEEANALRQLGNDSFLAKAPAPVIEGIRKRSTELVELLVKTRSALDALASKR
jgi:valyl-tRNA synthetase